MSALCLPPGWVTSKVGDVCDILDARRVPVNSREREHRNGDVPYYGATGQVGWIDDFLFDEELILLGEDGAPFLDPAKSKAYMVRGKSWVNNHAHVLRARAGVLNSFLLHQLNTVDYHPYVTGSTRLKLPQAPMREIPLVVAPLAEQRRIVAALEEHLSDLAAAVEGLERARVNTDRFRSAVVSACVEGRLEGEAAADGRPRYSRDALFDLPPGWAWEVLGEHLVDIQAGASFKCEERPPEPGETGVAKVSAVTWGTYDEDESKTVRDSSRIDDALLIRPGDFLFSRANTIQLVGACVIAERVTRRVMLSDKILRLRFRDLDPRWALTVLRSRWGRFEIERLATGNQESMRNIGQERIRAIRIPIPPLEEQSRLVSEVERRLGVAEHAEHEIDVQLARAARLRQSILKRAFEGKLVPQDPNDEPAEALLARIRAQRETPRPARKRGRSSTSSR